MAGYKWLADDDNRQAAYQVAEETVARLQPEELPLLEGLFTNYVELAQDSDVHVDREHPFGFAGGEILLPAIATDLAISIMNTLLIAAGAWTVRQLIAWWREQPNISEQKARELAAVVSAAVAAVPRLSAEERRQLEACLVAGLTKLLSRG